jgi:hypothetical protein
MSSILNLQGVIIYKIKEYDLKFAIKIGQPRRPNKCKFCNHKKPNKHGKGKKRTVQHGTAPNGKRIILHWQGQRYKCTNCNKTWITKMPKHLVRGKQRFSEYCKKKSFANITN